MIGHRALASIVEKLVAQDRLIRIIVMVVLTLCVVDVLWLSTKVGFLTIDYNEGWNAYHQAASVSGGLLYPGADSMMFNNYPPLSFFIVGLFATLIGSDTMVAGRLLSIVAFLIVVAGVYIASRIMRVGRLEATFAAVFFSAMMLVVLAYVGVNDPQMLGQAIAMLGFLCVLSAPVTDSTYQQYLGMLNAAPRRRMAVVTGALLLTLAGLVKHNLLVQPLVLFIWLTLYAGSLALWFAASGVIFSTISVAVMHLLYPNLISGVLAMRAYSVRKVVSILGKWLIVWGVPIAGIIVCLREYKFWHDKYMVLCLLYIGIGLGVGGFFIGGAGAGSNMLIDTLIAFALCTGLIVNRWRDLYHRRALFALACMLPLVFVLVARNAKNWTPDYWLNPHAAQRESAARDVAFLRSHPAPVACEILSLCYWAGKPAMVDFFNLSQAVIGGKRTDDLFVSKIEAREFSVIQVLSLEYRREAGGNEGADTGINQPFSKRVHEALVQAYRVDHSDENGVFLVPSSP